MDGKICLKVQETQGPGNRQENPWQKQAVKSPAALGVELWLRGWYLDGWDGVEGLGSKPWACERKGVGSPILLHKGGIHEELHN